MSSTSIRIFFDPPRDIKLDQFESHVESVAKERGRTHWRTRQDQSTREGERLYLPKSSGKTDKNCQHYTLFMVFYSTDELARFRDWTLRPWAHLPRRAHCSLLSDHWPHLEFRSALDTWWMEVYLFLSATLVWVERSTASIHGVPWTFGVENWYGEVVWKLGSFHGKRVWKSVSCRELGVETCLHSRSTMQSRESGHSHGVSRGVLCVCTFSWSTTEAGDDGVTHGVSWGVCGGYLHTRDDVGIGASVDLGRICIQRTRPTVDMNLNNGHCEKWQDSSSVDLVCFR